MARYCRIDEADEADEAVDAVDAVASWRGNRRGQDKLWRYLND
jgi:hypothetical protein